MRSSWRCAMRACRSLAGDCGKWSTASVRTARPSARVCRGRFVMPGDIRCGGPTTSGAQASGTSVQVAHESAWGGPMNGNDGSTARGARPRHRSRSLEGRLAREVRQCGGPPGASPESAAEGIDRHPVVPGGHRPFWRWSAGLAEADRPRSPRPDQAARRCLSGPWRTADGLPRGRSLLLPSPPH